MPPDLRSNHDLRFVARCALGVDDAAEVRLSKIERMIEECKFGRLCAELRREQASLTFLDMSEMIAIWLRANR